MFMRRICQSKSLFRTLYRPFSTQPEFQEQPVKPASQTIVPESASTDPENLTRPSKNINDEQLKNVHEYKEALKFYQQGRYRISNEFFKRVLSNIEKSSQKGSENHIHILKK